MQSFKWILGLFLPLSAFAITSFDPPYADREIRLGVQGNSYLTKNRRTISDERTGNFGVQLGGRGLYERAAFRSVLEGEALYGLRKSNYRYVDVGEVYAGLAYTKWGTYAGRKRQEWSLIDSYWPLGLYQPRFRWDYLNEREGGIFGAFVDFEPSEQFSFVVYGSPIFIPETGAPFDISSGECKTASPWFACPSSTVLLFNQATDVRFNLSVPPIRKLINHKGLGATLRIGSQERAHFRFSYSYKPMNQLLLAYEGRLDLSTLVLPATIHPRVLYHHLYSFDTGVRLGEASLVAGAIWEKPVRDITPAHWNTQEASDATLGGLIFRAPFGPAARIELAYLHRKDGNAPDRGAFAQTDASVFEPRYAFKNTYSGTLITSIFDSWAERFTWSTRFVLDTANNGNILISDFHLRAFERALLNLGIDILGSDNRNPVDFISRYQRNDRVRGGVSYAF